MKNEAKDWVGNRKSVPPTLGASNHSEKERQQHDYYATDPKAMELLLAEEQFAQLFGSVLAEKGIYQRYLKSMGMTLSVQI